MAVVYHHGFSCGSCFVAADHIERHASVEPEASIKAGPPVVVEYGLGDGMWLQHWSIVKRPSFTLPGDI